MMHYLYSTYTFSYRGIVLLDDMREILKIALNIAFIARNNLGCSK